MIANNSDKVFNVHQPEYPPLLVGWSHDAGQLGVSVTDFIGQNLHCDQFFEIDLPNFFSLGAVAVENDIVQFPESKFYSSKDKDLLVFKSTVPNHNHYDFLNSVLDVAENYCGTTQIYTLGGVASSIDHTRPRKVSIVVNNPKLKNSLAGFGIDTNLNHQTPPGGSPTVSTFLSWIARERNIDVVNFWIEVPFYLHKTRDPRAIRRVISIMNSRFDLGMDLSSLELDIKTQDEKLEDLRLEQIEVGKYMEILESGIALDEEEKESLTLHVTRFLKDRK